MAASDTSAGADRDPGTEVVVTAPVAAVEHVRAVAMRDGDEARERIDSIIEAAASTVDADELVRSAASRPVSVHFHPDRIVRTGPHAGRLTIEALALTATFENQFVTGTSSGSVDAGRDGRRFDWEDRLFGTAYSGAAPRDRARYGALDLWAHPDGACIGFGSCHLVLAPSTAARVTFTLGDSYLQPDIAGTVEVFEPILAGLLVEAERSGTVFGRPMTVCDLVEQVTGGGPGAWGGVVSGYVEAQVHGGIDLASDVDVIVADPVFRSTPTGAALVEVCSRLDLALRWHAGVDVVADELPSELVIDGATEDVSGHRRFAQEIAARFAGGRGVVDAAVVGAAARSVVTDPERWTSWGAIGEVLQWCKETWKVVILATNRA